ncbi:MAG TPA: VOC family protein [Bacillales bacterium]
MAKRHLNIQKVGQVSVPVHDLGKAVQFYQEVLELPFLFEAPNMAFFECNGLRLLLSIPENDQFDHPSSTLYFQVEDIQRSFELLTERGTAVLGKPHKIAEMDGMETWMAFFKDPDENIHALTSEVPTK